MRPGESDRAVPVTRIIAHHSLSHGPSHLGTVAVTVTSHESRVTVALSPAIDDQPAARRRLDDPSNLKLEVTVGQAGPGARD